MKLKGWVDRFEAGIFFYRGGVFFFFLSFPVKLNDCLGVFRRKEAFQPLNEKALPVSPSYCT